MRRYNVMLLLLLLMSGLPACSPGHLGSNVIAFIRAGQLWTIDPDGANAFAVVTQGPPVISYNWAPNHQLLTFRALDQDFAKTSAAKHLLNAPITGLTADEPSTVNTIGVDGGTPIPVAFSDPAVRYSTAMWNSTSTRLLYRQTDLTPPNRTDKIRWWISQNDQPAGIAIKSVPGSFSIPSLSYADPPLAIGNSYKGIFTTTLAGTQLHYLQTTPLTGHPLPASLERVLWQPAHNPTRILYAITTQLKQKQRPSPFTVQLTLREPDGQITPVTTCACIQFAWSPDGNNILYSTAATYTIFNLANHTSFTIKNIAGSVPYWSPDSQFIAFDGPHTLTLVSIKDKWQQTVLSDSSTPTHETGSPSLPDTTALLQPVANSIWASDSRHFLFLARNRSYWQGHSLQAEKGLYTVTITDSGHPHGTPTLVDIGNDTQPGWTAQDANTSFLY